MEQIYQKFIEFIGKTDLSSRTLNGIADSLCTAEMTEDQLKEAFEKGKKLVKTAEGNINAVIAAKVKDAVDEKLKDIEEKAKAKALKEAKEKNPEEDPAVSALQKQLAEVMDKLKTQEQEQLVTSKKKEIIAKLKESGIEDEEFCVEAVDSIYIDGETNVDESSAKVVKLYNKFKSKAAPEDGNISGRARGVAKTNDLWAEQFKQLKPTE